MWAIYRGVGERPTAGWLCTGERGARRFPFFFLWDAIMGSESRKAAATPVRGADPIDTTPVEWLFFVFFDSGLSTIPSCVYAMFNPEWQARGLMPFFNMKDYDVVVQHPLVRVMTQMFSYMCILYALVSLVIQFWGAPLTRRRLVQLATLGGIAFNTMLVLMMISYEAVWTSKVYAHLIVNSCLFSMRLKYHIRTCRAIRAARQQQKYVQHVE